MWYGFDDLWCRYKRAEFQFFFRTLQRVGWGSFNWVCPWFRNWSCAKERPVRKEKMWTTRAVLCASDLRFAINLSVPCKISPLVWSLRVGIIFFKSHLLWTTSFDRWFVFKDSYRYRRLSLDYMNSLIRFFHYTDIKGWCEPLKSLESSR